MDEKLHPLLAPGQGRTEFEQRRDAAAFAVAVLILVAFVVAAVLS